MLLELNSSASCDWPAQFSIQVLLSESFEEWLQRYVLLHAGVIETLKVNKMENFKQKITTVPNAAGGCGVYI